MSDHPVDPRSAQALVRSLFQEVATEVNRDIAVQMRGLDLAVAGRPHAERKLIADSLWREDPIGFPEFVVSPEHMGQSPLSKRQREDIENFIGTDPKRLFTEPETTYRMAVLLWGKGCLVGSTLLTDAETGTTRTMEEWAASGDPLTLRTTDGKTVFDASTSQVDCIGEEEVYEVRLEDGRCFVGAANHRVLTQNGWAHVRDLEGCAIAAVANNDSPSCGRPSVHRCCGTTPDSLDGCPTDLHCGDEPLHPCKDADGESPPSQPDVHERIPSGWLQDALDPESTHSRSCLGCDPEKADAFPQDFLEVASRLPFAVTSDAPSLGEHSTARQSHPLSGLPGTNAASLQSDERLVYVHVASVTTKGIQPIYDLTVEGTECYADAQGIIHHNSGKDWIVSLLEAYFIYVLLCTHEPRILLRWNKGENIDIVNVATTEKQAVEVFFAKFEGRILNWKWIRDRYLIVKSGRKLNGPQHPDIRPDDPERVITIGSHSIEFPHYIRHWSYHAQNESYEGKSILFWVMDEASAFRDRGKKSNGWAVFRTLRTSAKTRFNAIWRGLVISFPRSENDFTMQLHDMSEGDPEVYLSRAATWEVNPRAKREDYAADYAKDPEMAACMYECRPPSSEYAYLNRQAVQEAFLTGMASKIQTSPAIVRHGVIHPTLHTQIMRNFIAKTLDAFLIEDLRDRSTPRVAHVDGGLRGDSAGLIVAHGVPQQVSEQTESGIDTYIMNRVVVDAVLEWEPDRGAELQVSLNNVASILADIAKRVPLKVVTYDQWNSASAIEALQGQGIFVEEHNINALDYGLVKQLLNMRMIDVPTDEFSAWEKLWREMRQLEAHASGTSLKIDHPPDGSKDLADCVAGVARLLNNIDARKASEKRRTPGLRTLSGAGADSSPFAATQTLRAGRVGSTLVDRSIRTSEPVARLHRAAAEPDDVQLPRGNQGAVIKVPRIKRL